MTFKPAKAWQPAANAASEKSLQVPSLSLVNLSNYLLNLNLRFNSGLNFVVDVYFYTFSHLKRYRQPIPHGRL